MDVSDLEMVLAVCRAGGISAAARERSVSQPTLSRSLARLEADLGLKLFERSKGAAQPTYYGRFLAERATAIVQEIHGLAEVMHQLAKGERGRLRIAAGPVARLRPVPQLLERISRDFPGLSIEMMFESGPGVMEAVDSGRAELGIGNASRALGHESLMRQRLYEDTPLFVARAGHPILQAPQPGPRDLLRHPFALLSVAPDMADWLAPQSVEEAGNLRSFVCEDFNLVQAQVERTESIGFAPGFLFAEAIAEGRLVVIPAGYRKLYTCWLLGRKDMWRSPVVQAIVALARAASHPAR